MSSVIYRLFRNFSFSKEVTRLTCIRFLFASLSKPKRKSFTYKFRRKPSKYAVNSFTTLRRRFIAMQMASVVTVGDIEENIIHLLTLARVALEKGDADRAEAILEMGLKISEDHEVYIGLPYIYDILTSISLAHGNIERAELLLVTACERLAQIGLPENNHHTIDFKLRLARIYSNSDATELAEMGFRNCLGIQSKKIEDGDISTRSGMLYTNILFWYGVHLIRNTRYEEARRLLDRAYDYSISIKGLSPYQEMVILYMLGDLNLELGQYHIALKNLLNAVLLGKGISSIDLPKCYVKLAKTYSKMHVYNLAENFALEGMKMGRLFNNLEVVDEAGNILEEVKRLKALEVR